MPARIVWCTSVDDAHQVGLAFKLLSSDRAQDLTMLLRYLQDTVSGRVKRPRVSIDERFD